MLFFCYDLLLLLLTPLLIAVHAYRTVRRGRSFAGFSERLGWLDPALLARLAGRPAPVWVHAVSVGETLAVRSLLKELRRRYPQRPLILSGVTETGRQIAATLPELDGCLYLPFDLHLLLAVLLKRLRPALLVIVETELWPGFLRAAADTCVPVVLANGRISDRSFPRYRRLRWFFAPLLAKFAACCMQSEEDARRMVAMGAPAERVFVARNLKYDLPPRQVSADEHARLRRRYRLPADAPVLVAGSTHAGEEEQLLAAYRAVLAGCPQLRLVLVPRHPERAGGVAELLARREIACVRRSTLTEQRAELADGEVLLVDTIGELMDLYALADLVFVGGSLVDTGGHNLLEPASLGVPVLFGPHMHNFREIASLVLAADAGEQVADAPALVTSLERLLADAELRRRLGANGRNLLAAQAGGAERHLQVLERFLAERG